MIRSILFAVIYLYSVIPVSAQEEVSLFDFWQFYSDAENSMYKTSCALAFEQLEQREMGIAQLKTKNDFLTRQAKVREKLTRLLGPMPERTPLNARVTGVIKKKDYLVEKVIFESVPGYYVTAALFLPEARNGKLPAVIYACGHTVNGFRSPVYQRVAINLVKKGFAVLAFDPVGQGERWQYFNEGENTRRFNSATIEHSYPGAQCYIAGYSPTNYFVWDGMRCVDYLLSRKEIDPERIGMTGRSGGGTQTAFTAAIDERILAAAPECFITSTEYILKSIGPQDAEQNIFHMTKEGLDHADLLEVRAPKPGLMLTTTRDFFSIQGARETFREVKQFYQGLGAGNFISMVEDDDQHASTKKNREAMYAFFQEHLDNPGSSQDIDVQVFEEEQLWVTESGQLATSIGSETLFTLNAKQVQKQTTSLSTARSTDRNYHQKAVASAREISGFTFPASFEAAVFSGRYQLEHYELEKYLVPGSGDYQLPVALFNPKVGSQHKLVVILDELGMAHAATRKQLIHTLVQEGFSVLLADLPGIGSLGPGYLKGDAYIDNTSFNQWFAGIMTGRSIVAIRAEDIMRIAHFARTEMAEVASVSAISFGALGSELLHAANFGSLIQHVGLINPFLSYAGMALSRDYKPSYITSVVAGAINDYDLPDLMAGLSPKRVFVANPLDPTGAAYSRAEVTQWMDYPTRVFADSGNSDNLRLAVGLNDSQINQGILGWLK
jgi:dienelactone hydrolase